jgi:hypothetical protein
MPEGYAADLIELLKPAIAAGASEEVLVPVLTVLEYICRTHTELFMESFPLPLWCDMLRCRWPPETLYRLLRVLAREIRESKSDLPITDTEFSMAVVAILDDLLAYVGTEKRVVSAVVDLALAFAIRNMCWLTFFRDAALLERLFSLFPIKSSTVRITILNLAQQAYLQNADSDIFNLELLIASLRHTMSCIQCAAVNCIITYVQRYPRRLGRLVELGLCGTLLEILREGSFAMRCRTIDLLAQLVISDETMVEIFLGEDIITEILPLMHNSADCRRIASLLTILKHIRNFCVVHGQGRLFIEKFDTCEGFDIIEGMADVRDGLVAEDARIFIEEVAFLERAVQ